MFRKIRKKYWPAAKKHYQSGGIAEVVVALRVRNNRRYVKSQRAIVSARVARAANYTVRHGPFKGLLLNEKEWWGCDLGTKCMGLYEQQNQILLSQLSVDNHTFIDLGGADGYFALGALINQMFERSIVFEQSEIGQQSIKSAALKNGLTDKITIHGEANEMSLKKLAESLDLSQCVFLIDIEGGEYDLLSHDVLMALRQCNIIVEMHGNTTERSKLNLFRNAITTHEVIPIETGPRNPRGLKDLDGLMDDDCFLLLSEGRAYGYWLHLKPKI